MVQFCLDPFYAALEYLQQRFQGESEWTERLGYVYFQNRDTRRTLELLADTIEQDAESVSVQSLLVAAEAARQEDEYDRAVSMLERARALHPDRLSVLNNLVYMLAEKPATVGKAKQLLPELLEKGGDTFAVLDTAAFVFLKAGQLGVARKYMDRALALLDGQEYSALEGQLNAAEILFRLGEYENARNRLRVIQDSPELTPRVDQGARDLLERIRQEAGRW